MALKITRFLLHHADAQTHDMTVMPADRMRAERLSASELAPSQRGGPAAHPETWVLLWLWCTATRLGHTTERFEPWADTVAGYERLDAEGNPLDDEEEDEAAVDPTPEAGSITGPSSSPRTTAP